MRVSGDDEGSASLWMLAACALVIVAATAGVLRGDAALARHRAEAVADLAALAAADQIGIEPNACAAAVRIAAANGAHLASCRLALAVDGRSGEARITVATEITLPLVNHQTVTASARAARDPGS